MTTKGSKFVARWEDVNRLGAVMAVQAGTFMGQVTSWALKQARPVRISPPSTSERKPESGRVDVFKPDYPHSRRLLDSPDWAALLTPLKSIIGFAELGQVQARP